MGSMDKRIRDLIKNPGLPSDVMEGSRASLLAANKSGFKDAVLRRSGQGSARGLFDSGIREVALQGIEGDFHGKYMDALNQLEMENARQALQGLGLASSHLLGKKGLNVQRMLGLKNIALQRELGLGNLGVARSAQADERAWREFQMNMIAQGYSPYSNAASSFAGIPASGPVSYGSGSGGGPRGGRGSMV
jgi:hypothetical protein